MATLIVGLATISARELGPLLGLGIATAMSLQFWLAHSGILQKWDRFPPPFMLLFVPTLVLTTRLAFSSLGKKLAENLSFMVLVGAQAFRLPLELVMHHAAREGVMPVQLSYSGWNFDVITGATAILVAIVGHRREVARPLLFAWNLMGSALLATVVGIALASMPPIHAFGSDRMNTWVTYAPFVWLPGMLVPIALFLHLLLWRKLRMQFGQYVGELPAEGSKTSHGRIGRRL
jgi:hypothetical protein